MKRLKYKSLYLEEKADKEIYKESLNKLLETLKTFNNIKVLDKVQLYRFNKIRTIEVRQNEKYLQISFNLDILESEVN